MGYIEQSKSPYSSPIVMVKKKTGVKTVHRLQANQRQVGANAPNKLYSRPTEGSTVHKQLGPEGWVLGNPTEKKQQAIHCFYSAGKRLAPVESNAIWTLSGVCDFSTVAGPCDRTRNVTGKSLGL